MVLMTIDRRLFGLDDLGIPAQRGRKCHHLGKPIQHILGGFDTSVLLTPKTTFIQPPLKGLKSLVGFTWWESEKKRV